MVNGELHVLSKANLTEMGVVECLGRELKGAPGSSWRFSTGFDQFYLVSHVKKEQYKTLTIDREPSDKLWLLLLLRTTFWVRKDFQIPRRVQWQMVKNLRQWQEWFDCESTDLSQIWIYMYQVTKQDMTVWYMIVALLTLMWRPSKPHLVNCKST